MRPTIDGWVETCLTDLVTTKIVPHFKSRPRPEWESEIGYIIDTERVSTLLFMECGFAISGTSIRFQGRMLTVGIVYRSRSYEVSRRIS